MEAIPGIREFLAKLVEPNQVFEIRVLWGGGRVDSGHFNSIERAAEAAAAIESTPYIRGVFITANPVDPALLTRAKNEIKQVARKTTSEGEILRRRWVLVDLDPVRPHGVAATELEHAAALQRAGEVQKWLSGLDWPDPVFVDSGNGVQLLFPVDLPNDSVSTALVKRCLEALDLAFSDGQVVIDKAVWKACQLVRLPGTLNAKGHDTADRPHRIARLIKAPSPLTVLDRKLLESMAARAPAAAVTMGAPQVKGMNALDVGGWLRQHGIEVATLGAWNGGHKWVLKTCPWDPSHMNRSAYVVQFPNGAIAAGCHHSSCQGRNWADFRALLEAAGRPQEPEAMARTVPSTSGCPNPWLAAQSIIDFLATGEVAPPWLEKPLLAPGAITECFSPRGIGKTHIGYSLAVKLAKAGKRVLILDRDNPPGEVRRRLKEWGADKAPNIRILARDKAPSLTDTRAWSRFPIGEYDLVIIDSLDSSAEGMGEKDSAKPARALAPLLDLAHGANGPAILVLGNVVKSGAHSRGNGVVEDRADIVFEIRDATQFTPAGTKEWWEELPPADAGSWGPRASRRQRRERLRLACIPTKFRLGREPEPFIVEIDFTTMPWSVREVTDEVTQAGVAAREVVQEQHQTRLEAAETALMQEIVLKAPSAPMRADRDGVPFLMGHGLSRAEARQVLVAGNGRSWRSVVHKHQRGQPRVLLPMVAETADVPRGASAGMDQSKTPQQQTSQTRPIPATRMNTGSREPAIRQPASDRAISTPGLLPPSESSTAVPHETDIVEAIV